MKKTLKTVLALLLAAAIVFPFLGFTPGLSGVNAEENDESAGRSPDEIVTIMVKLKDQPVLARYSLEDSRSAALKEELKAKQDRVIEIIGRKLTGSPVDVIFRYSLLFNGFAFRGEYRLIEKIKDIEGVKNCYESWSYELPEKIESSDETRLATSVGWINADDMWALGYTGQGQTIAVIDTGIKKNHPNFAAAPVDPHFSASNLQAVLDSEELCAEELYNGTLTGQTLYYSAKIPYTFNYATGTTDVSHTSAQNDHGTHVSSICAGNDSSARGVAYNAQILAMQVFDGSSAEWTTILAALEDCAHLQVDALNMSLGADCGFTHDEDLDPVFELLTAAGVNCAVASGNSTYAGSGSLFNGTNPTFNFDIGVTSTPGSALAALSVAASDDNASLSLASYSSWGSTSYLRIKPEIIAPGSNINAATDSTYSGGNYGTKSGTSMATPHIAGSMALVNQYVNTAFPNLSETAKMKMVNTLLMCTAVPAVQNGLYYSPRAQGAGQADLIAAISTRAYIEVPNCDRPKIELGDDDDKTGVFTFTFDVVNYGNTALTYTVQPTVMTERTNTWLIGGQPTTIMDHAETDITADCTVQKPNTITVPAGGRTSVSITISLGSYASTLESLYPLGAYIEGYVKLDGDVDLSVPFLGFYGDWEYSALFDRKCYFDTYLGSQFNYPNQWGTNVAAASVSGGHVNLGVNPFTATTNFLLDRASISPNGDGFMDAVDTVHTYMLRNAETFRYEVVDADTGEQYYVKDIRYVGKGVANTWLSYYQPVGAEDWTMMDPWSGSGLPNNTHAILRMTGWMDGTEGSFDPADNEFASWEVPVTVDLDAPEVVYWNMHNGELNIYVSDNHYVAWVGVYSNSSMTSLIAEEAVEEVQRGALTMLTFNVGSRDTVYVKVGDYAYNVTTQTITEGEGGSLDPVALTGAHFENSSVTVFTGYSDELRIVREPANANNFETTWTSSNPNVATVTGGMLKGVVTGVSEGTATITATVHDKGTNQNYVLTASVTVNGTPTLNDALNVTGGSIEFTSTGSYPWTITNVSGRLCAMSTNQSVSSSSSTVTTAQLDLEAGDKLEFWWSVSSESNYDKLRFYVNNGELTAIDGNVAWTKYTYTVQTSGTYTFKWVYEKDSSVNSGDDTGWLDDVRIIPVSPAFVPGDCDLSGSVGMEDALLALRHSMGLITLTGDAFLAGDVNGSGAVDMSDALAILRYAMGLISWS